MADKPAVFDFNALVAAIRKVHEHLVAQAGRAVNISLTLRNWLIGAYIAEYELRGADSATYGESLLAELSKRLTNLKVSNCNRRQLYRYLRFYRLYPEIVWTLSPQLQVQLPKGFFKSYKPHHEIKKVGTPSPQLQIPVDKLINRLSYSHFELLADLDDNFKRTFYEIECIRGNWSVRELKRQIGSLYYERSGFSENKEKLSMLVQSGAEKAEPKLAIRDPYVFEFLGIKSREVMSETDLENALLDKLQDFLMELGHGFCFEARQKRILIGNTHGFVDLIFYHRILKCHVLVELKVQSFSHENLGQLNTYVSWYRKNMMSKGDNPPVGILLRTQKDHALVEYALAGMDNKMFVSKYQLELPKKEEIQRFLEDKMREVPVDDKSRGVIPDSIKLIAGRTGQEFNQRKARKGAYWEDRYHATAIEDGDHLIKCIVNIDLNMVRAGVVKHPSEWPYSGYNEIQQPKRKNILINYENLKELLGFDSYEQVKTAHKQWVEGCLSDGDNFRDDKWTESIAVGSEPFVHNVKVLMGGMALGRKVLETGKSFQLKEVQYPYNDHFGAKRSDIGAQSTYAWDQNFENATT